MATQLGNGKERCLNCGGRGGIPAIEGLRGKVHPAAPCKECGGSGEVPSGTDPLSFPPLPPIPPVVPESQEVLRQTLEVDGRSVRLR